MGTARLRERRWDASAGKGIPNLQKSCDSDVTSPGWKKEHSVRDKALSAPLPQKSVASSGMSWSKSQELAANWAISLATHPVRQNIGHGHNPESADALLYK